MIPRTIGNYQLERELGRGGVAAVYLARHRALPRQVAVKVLLNHSEEQLERFRREAEITSQLRHPHIVEIYDHGMQGPFAYTVMQAAMGGSLRRRLEAVPGGRLALDEALRIFRQIGEALDFAHTKGIVHRDVSPGNVLLDESGTRTFLTDFGIARAEKKSGHTTAHMIMGTPGFFSPEHLRSARDVTAQSDLFALGLILYVMLSGDLPWQDVTSDPKLLMEPPPPLSERFELPKALDPVMLTLLAIDPQYRYTSASEALEALQRVFPAQLALSQPQESRVVKSTETILYLAPNYETGGVQPNPVEQYLGPQMNRQIVERTHKRAAMLGRPEILVELLEDWSREERFRRRHLGRLATFHESHSYNVYFYQFDVLIEQRSEPFVWEQPDRERRPMTGKLEVSVWDVELPKPADFSEAEGTVTEIEGSEQVSSCSSCNGKSNILCSTCRGNGRITITTTVEKPIDARDQDGRNTPATMTQVQNVVRPCPECHGKGFVVCPTCKGIGMVIRKKGFKWTRKPATISSHDDLPNVDEAALEAEALEIYDQTHTGILQTWRSVPALQPLIENVESLLDQHSKIVLARVHIRMVPVTRVQFELNRRGVVQNQQVAMVDHDDDPDTPAVITVEQKDDTARESEMHTLHLLGFNNTISADEAKVFRDWPRILNLGTIAFLGALVVIMLLFIIVVYG